MTCSARGNAITAIPCREAMLLTEDGEVSTGQISRDKLKRTQTPQTFHVGDLMSAHLEAEKKGITNSVASCTLFVELGRPLYFTGGSEKNIKITTVDDIDVFKALLKTERPSWLK